MVAASRCLASVALFATVEGARVGRKRSTIQAEAPNTKFIAGVPVINYHAAYGGEASMSSLEESREQDWIVVMEPGSTDEQVASLCWNNEKGCKMVGHPGKQGVPFVDLRGTEKDLERVLERAQGKVKFVEPDQTMYMIPELEANPASASWGLNRVGANGRSGNQGANTHIYILDTGVRTTHQDFGSRGTPAADYTTGSPKECNGDLECAADRQGHGTHCAGSAGGATFGVATQSNIYGVKVLGDNGSGGFAAIVGAIDYLASSGARPTVGSMSLGGQCPFGWCGLMGSVKTAVDTAVDAGVTIVVAGGNSNSDACGFVPAFVPSAITVGSTDSTDARSFFSNYGRCTNIWAPGSDITSASHQSDSGSATFSGTSMACPHVAGGAALMLESNPDFNAPQVLEKLLAKAATNFITDLKSGDTNKLLYVAADAPPPPGSVGSLVESEAAVDEELRGGCTNGGDRTVIRNRFNSLVGDVRGCVIGCIGRGDSCSVSCVQNFGFTNGCARCVAGLGSCAKSNCWWSCLSPSSDKCTKCTVDYCYGDLVRCSGLPQSELPRP